MTAAGEAHQNEFPTAVFLLCDGPTGSPLLTEGRAGVEGRAAVKGRAAIEAEGRAAVKGKLTDWSPFLSSSGSSHPEFM